MVKASRGSGKLHLGRSLPKGEIKLFDSFLKSTSHSCGKTPASDLVPTGPLSWVDWPAQKNPKTTKPKKFNNSTQVYWPLYNTHFSLYQFPQSFGWNMLGCEPTHTLLFTTVEEGLRVINHLNPTVPYTVECRMESYPSTSPQHRRVWGWGITSVWAW